MTRALIEKLVDAMNKHGSPYLGHIEEYQAALTAAREYLAQPNTQEPVATMTLRTFRGHIKNHDVAYFGGLPDGTHSLFTHPAPQQVAVPVPMTDDQIEEMALQEDLLSICDDFYALREITRAVEAHHGKGAKP